MNPIDVLIVGAGPTGLVLALWLTRLGVRVRIIDKLAGPATTSRALAVQARTLELYRQLDLAEAVVSRGHKVPALNLWAEGRRKAHIDFTHIGAELTPYAFIEVFPQDEHERLLIDRLSAAGVSVERQTELLDVEDEPSRAVARLKHHDGSEERCEARFVAACDGARSVVREALGLGFPGGTYQDVFYVADVDASGPAVNGELHVDLDVADFVAVFPLASTGRVRLVGSVRETAAAANNHTFEDVGRRAVENLNMAVSKVNWFSTYRVHHRVAEHFRKGRVFLLGDAAHVHSPVGGQGMNTGIGDAVNLAWKLASVLQGRSADGLLDSYEPERIGFARKLVATTDRAFNIVTAEGRMADLVRTRIAPAALSGLLRFQRVKDLLFKTASQMSVHYRSSPLSEGKAGHLSGGDRLPWTGGSGTADNFGAASSMRWQIHVYGTASDAVQAWSRRQRVPLEVFAWQDRFDRVGFRPDAVYLVRPDAYIGLVDPFGEADGLERYVAERHLCFASA